MDTRCCRVTASFSKTAAVAVIVVVVALVFPFVHAAAPSVHEKIRHSGDLEAELLRNGHLHFLRGPLGLLEYGLQGAPLYISKHQPRLLQWRLLTRIVALLIHLQLLLLLLLLDLLLMYLLHMLHIAELIKLVKLSKLLLLISAIH